MGKFKCNLCSVSFQEMGQIREHVKSVHEGNQQLFKCGFCDEEVFEDKESLIEHVKSVHEKKNIHEEKPKGSIHKPHGQFGSSKIGRKVAEKWPISAQKMAAK